MRVDVRIEGKNELRRLLQSVSDTIAKRLMTKALQAAAEPVRQDAMRRAPRRTGQLGSEKGIVIDVDNNTVRVGTSKNAFYGIFQELGTRHHRAQPFLRPAMDAKRSEACCAAAETLRSGIEEVLR